MNNLSGTWRLIRLVLRRDRIKLSIWLIAIIATLAATVPAVIEAYDTPETRAAYVTSVGTSMVGRMFGGVLDGGSLGAILMVEAFAFTATLIAFMNTLLVVRHTRKNEEMGSSELLQSARVGRYASLTAVLLVATVANIIIGIATGLIVMSFEQFSVSGGWILGATFALTGISFAAIAALTSQLSGSSRGANGLAGATIGIAYLLRALGDGFASHTNGMYESAWPSWLSPLGWGQQVYAMTRQELWVFGIFIGFTIICLSFAYIAMSKRDVGSGMLAARKGPARASSGLLSVFGLSWRLQYTSLIWWSVSMVIVGVLYGGIADQFKELLTSSETIQAYVGALGGEGKVVDAFLSAMLGVTAIIVVGYVVQALQKLRSEETSSHLESILGTATGRISWIFSHTAIVAFGVLAMMVSLALSTALSSVLVAGQSWSKLDDILVAGLVYLPAIAVCLSLIVACFGLLPRLVVALSWSMFVILIAISQLGALLKFPDYIMNISPFSHIPLLPSEVIEPMPLLTLVGISVVLFVLGVIAFVKRDITAS